MPQRALTYDPGARIGPKTTTEELIAIMKEEDELARQRRILDEMSPALREKYEEIGALLWSEIRMALENRHALGVHFLDIYNDQTQHGSRVYGKQAIPHICRLLSLDESFVRACIKFAQNFTTEDLARLPTLPRGEPLSWGHVRCVLQLEDRSKRQELLQKTAEEGWTCGELAYEIKQLGARAEPARQGRPLKVPANFDGALQQQKQFTEDWERRYAKVWSHPRHSLETRAAELPPEQVTEQRLREAGELAHQLRLMANQAVQAAERAEEVVRRFERVLVERMDPQLPSSASDAVVPEQQAGMETEQPKKPAKRQRRTTQE